MEKSRGSKKALKAVLAMMALVAALATTGCTGSTLMGPEKTAATGGQEASQAGHTMKPGAETMAGQTMRP